MTAELEDLELIGDGSTLDTAAVLARRPEVVCVDDLTPARRRPSAGSPRPGGWPTRASPWSAPSRGSSAAPRRPHPAALLDEAALLALADEIELVDVPPSILIDRVRRGEIVPPDQVDEALATTFAPDELRAARERAFRLVAEHGERRLAGYRGASRRAGRAATGSRPSWPASRPGPAWSR